MMTNNAPDTPDTPQAPERPALLYGAAAIAAYVGVTEHAARNLIDRGLLPAFHLGGRVVARPDSIDASLADQERRQRKDSAA